MLDLSAIARQHFEQPRNVGVLNSGGLNRAEACVGEPISSDILQLQLQIDGQGVIRAACFKAYGCGWLIACGSLLTERIQGRTLADIGHFRHHELVETLDIPPLKLHCAVLAETALKAALRTFSASS